MREIYKNLALSAIKCAVLKTKNREVRALLKASRELRCKNLLVITYDYENKESIEWFGTRRKVMFVPLWEWPLKKAIRGD